MDKSKLPKTTKKSSEEPWKPTHEQRRLGDRSGTITANRAGIIPRTPRKSWKEDANPYYDEYIGGKLVSTNIIQGKEPKSGKPLKRTHGGLGVRRKKSGDEREY